ncbi:MAG TPA: hypothetical protein DD435_09805 [Cyanobacteria bacterium UBA8530]|nr:hypothetical protein [Cyanobacteria bacterium UBA8530]
MSFTRILDRYVLGELGRPFLFGVAAFILVMLSISLYNFTDLIFIAGAPTGTVLQLLLYSLPNILVLTFPVAYLFASLLGIGRMTKDFEIIALRACGIAFGRIIFPIMVGAVIVSIGNYFFNEWTVPWSNKQVARLKQDLTRTVAKPMVRANVFFKGTENRYFYIKSTDPKTGLMHDIFILDQTKAGLPQVITSKTGQWTGSIWMLKDGTLHKYDESGYVEHEIKFDSLNIQLRLDSPSYWGDDLDPAQMSAEQLKGKFKDLGKSGIDTKSLRVAYYMKFSVPLATFFAALIAAPLGLMFSRMGAYIGVALSIILVFLYYVIMATCQALGNGGILPPFLAAWIQNIVFGGVGAVLLWQVDR